MNKLEADINTVLLQLKLKLAAETWMSRRRYFKRMLRLAEKLGISEPCLHLYNAFIADDNGSKERQKMHIHCVKLLDEVAGTNAKDKHDVLYNKRPLPEKSETEEYFQHRSFPVAANTRVEYLIVKAETEMLHLRLSESTIGQYRHAWMDILNYSINSGAVDYDEPLLKAYLKDISIHRENGSMKEWKWKINRKATHVLMEIANTGCFSWAKINQGVSCTGIEIEAVRTQYLASLQKRNLSKDTIDLHDYVFRKTATFINAETQHDLILLTAEAIQLVINGFADICNKRSMTTIIPILRSLLVFFYDAGFVGKDLSCAVMNPFVQRGSVASYLSETDRKELVAQLDSEPKRTKAIILLAMKLGLRDSDIHNLTFQKIDWHHDKLWLNQEKTGEPLVLPLLPDVGNALMDYILNERPKRGDRYPYIFLRKHAPYNKLASVYMICSKLLRSMGITPVNGKAVGAHLLRYTLVHRLLAARVPHQAITDLLGHTSKESDKPYLTMEESMLRMCALDLSVIGRPAWKGGALNG